MLKAVPDKNGMLNSCGYFLIKAALLHVKESKGAAS